MKSILITSKFLFSNKIPELLLFFFLFRDVFIDYYKCRQKNDSCAGYHRTRLKSRSREYELGGVISRRRVKCNERILVSLKLGRCAVDIKLPSVFCWNRGDDGVTVFDAVDVEFSIAVINNVCCYLCLVYLFDLACECLIIKVCKSYVQIRPLVIIADE